LLLSAHAAFDASDRESSARTQVGTAAKESQLWRRPEDVLEAQFVGTVELGASPSDLAGQVAAAFTAAALALEDNSSIDRSTASSLVSPSDASGMAW
jgi:hypothetical protein